MRLFAIISMYVPRSQAYSTDALDDDLRGPLGPMQPLLDRLDSRIANPPLLSEEEFEDLLAFVRDGLLDSRANPARLRHLIPQHVPSGQACADLPIEEDDDGRRMTGPEARTQGSCRRATLPHTRRDKARRFTPLIVVVAKLSVLPLVTLNETRLPDAITRRSRRRDADADP